MSVSRKEFKIAIIGAGPAGYFAALALQNSVNDDRIFVIDMIERLPTPWGLVRSGVAPDHPKIKTVSKVFEKVAAVAGFRLFSNIELGKDITTTELTSRYDAVIISTGSSLGKKLGIPGEDLPNSLSAAEFVPWYNAHPDFTELQLSLDCESVVVIGAGNVAMDVGRMLALDPAELEATDTALYALRAFEKSSVRAVHICGRRGPEHVAFTSPELRELPKLEHTDVFINPDEINSALLRAEAKGEIEKGVRSNLEAMRLISESEKKGNARSLEFHFFSTPLEIKGDGKVEEVIFGINKVEGEKVIATGQTYSIKCGLVIVAIGYEAEAIDGVPYERGRVVNTDGRVPNSNIYTVGWAKRGPSGVIGTNKSDASDVIKLLIEDLTAPKNNGDITDLVKEKGLHFISQSGWEKLNNAEVAAGEILGKPRVKIIELGEALRLGEAI